MRGYFCPDSAANQNSGIQAYPKMELGGNSINNR